MISWKNVEFSKKNFKSWIRFPAVPQRDYGYIH